MSTGEPAASFAGSLSRRIFLKSVGAILFMAGTVSSICASIVKRLQVRTVEKELGPFNPEKYRLAVDGLVTRPRSFSFQDLKSLPQIEQISDFHCVEGWSVQDVRWGGFRFKEIMSRVEALAKATHVVFHSFGETASAPKGLDHYIESFPISELLDPQKEILLVLNMNHKPLPDEHGAPLRLIAPLKLGYKSIKFITRIEFADKGRPGWWTVANPIYSVEAEVPGNRTRKKN